MKNRVKKVISLVLSVTVVVLALWFITKQFQKDEEPKILAKELILVDAQVNKIFVWTLPATQEFEFPIPSPFTQKDTAYPAYKCLKCGAIFGTEGYISKELPVCPVCGSREISIPEIPQGQKDMDIPGPVKIVKVR